jgi:hypothetical protein
VLGGQTDQVVELAGTNLRRADDGRWLWRIASGTTVPGRVFDSADEPRPGATASRRAARKFSDLELEEDSPGVILCAIDFRVPVK